MISPNQPCLSVPGKAGIWMRHLRSTLLFDGGRSRLSLTVTCIKRSLLVVLVSMGATGFSAKLTSIVEGRVHHTQRVRDARNDNPDEHSELWRAEVEVGTVAGLGTNVTARSFLYYTLTWGGSLRVGQLREAEIETNKTYRFLCTRSDIDGERKALRALHWDNVLTNTTDRTAHPPDSGR